MLDGLNLLLNHLQIQPGSLFHLRIFQKKLRREGGDERDALKIVEPAAQLAQGFTGAEQLLCGEHPHGADHRGGNEHDFLEQEGEAGFHLIFCWRLRRMASGEQAQVDFCPAQADGPEHLVEELARFPAHGQAGTVVFNRGCIGDDQQLDPGRAFPGDSLASALMELAALAALYLGVQFGKGGIRHDCCCGLGAG